MSRSTFIIFNKDNGEIQSISNVANRSDSYIQVPLSDVMSLIDGVESIKNYHVQYNPKNKELELKSKYEFALDALTINDSIYEIPEALIDGADIQVVQDIPNTCWKIKLGDKLKENISRKGINLNTSFLFSITKKGDPNILYKTLSVHIGKTVADNYCVVPFDMPFETTDIPVSVYTARTFDTYQLTRIFNE
jgi:hypothetical protein